MFSTKETENPNSVPIRNSGKTETKRAFESIEQFSLWLDSELDVLVSQFVEFETDDSNRKFFKRS